MKHIKKFEQYTNHNIEIGDFVKAKTDLGIKKYTLLLKNIGVIKKIEKYGIINDVIIEYDTNIEDGFTSTKTLVKVKDYYIEDVAKTKEELEIKLASKKYNL